MKLAAELSQTFPSLDLRFNLRQGTTTVRCLVADYPERVLEFRLADEDLQTTVYEAILGIKQLARLFDA